ncbi:MAG: restriction endonuclease [Gemmatimonadetes bacterium]|nr:restriction endonuclease [Gemmatimonadota bacterium]
MSKLPPEKQEAIASIILEELGDERRWDEAFAASQDKLAKLAQKVRADIKAGRFKKMGRNNEMSDYTIYALMYSEDPARDAMTYNSLQNGVGRFGWSYEKTANLRTLQARIDNGDSLTCEEWDCYHPFLLDIKEEDYVVYINIPEWGKCTLARVTGPYFWSYEDDNFNHRFHVDPESVCVFDRNNTIVYPQLRRKLKLRGRWWRIYDLHEKFEFLIECLKRGEEGTLSTPETNIDWLKKDILSDITKKIQRTHPGSQLEFPIAEIFRNVPGVKEVKEQGGAGEHGADLQVIFEWEIPILEIQEQRICVVQVKSFEGEMWETKAVDQIQEALDYWNADMGIIVSTASSGSEALDTALNQLQQKTGKPVYLLIGEDVAAFLLRFGGQLLF